MKQFIISIVGLMTALTVNAQSRPHIEPGPVQTLSTESNQAVTVLLKVDAKDLENFRRHGNQIKGITVRMLAPGVVEYTFTRRQCMTGGIAAGMCLGGAQLQVIVETQSSNIPTEKVTSRVLVLR